MRNNNQRGFSLVEILMVLILIAVLAAIAINAFVNFRANAQTAALQANLKVLRTAISVQYAQMQLRCGENAGTFPPADTIVANDITGGATPPCTVGEVTIPSERQFVQGSIPTNPMGTTNTVTTCVGAATGCSRTDGTGCGGGAYTSTWCYNPASGEIWSDTAATQAL